MDLQLLEAMGPWEWPEETDEFLLGILRDKKAEEADRVLAAELAGDCVVINDALAEALLTILCDDTEPDELRARAPISFGPALELADMDDFYDPDDVPISKAMYLRILDTLHRLYTDGAVPRDVRRRILEGAIRAPQDWHADVVRAAYESGDEQWVLTAVFAMRYIRGFDKQIVEALDNANEEIECEAVNAAGRWAVDKAWGHVKSLVVSKDTDKDLLLAAIGAAASIRHKEASKLFGNLMNSNDEDIADAVDEALLMNSNPMDYGDYDDDQPF